MRPATLILLLTAFLIALSFSVANAGELEKEEKGKDKGGEEKDDREDEEEEMKKDKSNDKEGSGALSLVYSNCLIKVVSIAIACLFISIH